MFVLFVFNVSSKPLQKYMGGVESCFERMVFFHIVMGCVSIGASTGGELILNLRGAFLCL